MLSHSIHIKTDSFDGPLGLLLLLIQKEQMNIRELNINKITRQYLEYIERMQELNFDTAGDYLYMAAVLLFLKSRSFVSEEEVQASVGEEVESALHISSEAELIKRLQELKHYQELGQQLWTLPRLGHEIYTRPKLNRKVLVGEMARPMDMQELVRVWVDYLRRQKRRYKVLKRDRLSIKERLTFLKTLLKQGERANFFEILERDEKRQEGQRDSAILTFISLLELARLKKIVIFQNEKYGNIFIDVKESLSEFNVDLADGFGPESEAEQVADAI